MTTATKKSEITATAIFKVTVRATGKECYAVPSDSEPCAYYLACYDEQLPGWTCTCKIGQVQGARHQSANCKHARAAQLSIVVNKARRTEEARPYVLLMTDQKEADKKRQEKEAREAACAHYTAKVEEHEQQKIEAVKALGAMALALGQAATDAMIAQLHEEYERVVVPADRKRQQEQAAKREAKGTLNGSSQGFSLLK